MSLLLRHTLLIALSALISWWFLLRTAEDVAEPVNEPRVEEARDLAIDLMPFLAPEEEMAEATPAPAPQSEPIETEPEQPAPAPQEEPVEEPESTPPPPERGDPEGEGEQAEPEVETETAEEVREREANAMMTNPELVEAAEREVRGEAKQGFETVLVASPSDQLDIARSFGEEVVLVPRSALDPDSDRAAYFRLGPGGIIETVRERIELASFRQYRDLFDYEYARLPEPIRALRRSVLARSEVFLFAALIPASEWALVIGRRREALDQSGRSLDEVRRFTLRYTRRRNDRFDFEVAEILFVDGSRFRPADGDQP